MEVFIHFMAIKLSTYPKVIIKIRIRILFGSNL